MTRLVPQTLVLASGGVRCALAPVLAGSMRHGRILAIEGERPLQHDALIALERAATVIALDAAKQLAVTAVERKFQSDFLHELLSGRVRNEREILSRSRSLGWDLDRPLAWWSPSWSGAGRGALRPGGAPVARPPHRRWTSGGCTTVTRAAVAGFATDLVAIVGLPDRQDPEEAAVSLARSIAAGLARRSRHVLSVGVSRPVTSPVEVATAYDQATKAYRSAAHPRPGTVTRFDSLGVFRLLSLIDDAEELRSFALESLGPLLRSTRAERDDLLRTLEALVEMQPQRRQGGAAAVLPLQHAQVPHHQSWNGCSAPSPPIPTYASRSGWHSRSSRIREVLKDVPDQLPTRNP